MKKLPEGWEYPKIEDIFTILKGNGLSKNKIVKNGKNKCILYGELYTKYSEVIHEIFSRTNEDNGVKSKKGDILIPASTTTTGKDLANAVALNEDNVLLGGDINIFRMKKNNIDNIFMAHYLTHIKKREIASLTQGSTIIHLYGKNMKHLHIHVPPLEEQKKIAEILSSVDQKIAFVDNQIEETEVLKKGLMQKLLTEGIGHSEFKDSEIGRIPVEWEITTINSSCKNFDGKRVPIKSEDRKEMKGEYPYYGAQGIIDYVNNYIFEGLYLLVAEDGENVRGQKYNIAFVVEGKFWVNNHAHILQPNPELNINFIANILNHIDITKYVTGTGQPKLNKAQLQSIKIPLPPLEEQKQIAEILSIADEKLDNLKAKKKSFEELKKGLMQKLLTGEVRI